MSVSAGAEPGRKPGRQEDEEPGRLVARIDQGGAGGVPEKLPVLPRRRRQGQRPDGAGRHAPPNLTDDKWDRGSTDGEIFLVIRDGAGPKFDMKGYKSKMTEPDIWNVVNYLRSVQAK